MNFGKTPKNSHAVTAVLLNLYVSVEMKIDELHDKYWNGWQNKIIRYWFYLNRGIDIFNQFKYLFALIFGVYFTLKLNNAWWILGMTGTSLPILMVFGYLQTHKIGKVNDWLTVKFSTHYANYNFDLLEGILEELKQIKKESISCNQKK